MSEEDIRKPETGGGTGRLADLQLAFLRNNSRSQKNVNLAQSWDPRCRSNLGCSVSKVQLRIEHFPRRYRVLGLLTSPERKKHSVDLFLGANPIQVYVSSVCPNRPSGVDILDISNTFMAD